jgi:hypothetical protein
MTQFPYIFFNQTPETLRRIGARGGKTQARNRRARNRAAAVSPSPDRAVLETHLQTTGAAMAALDSQFPWLRGAERPGRNRRAEG